MVRGCLDSCKHHIAAFFRFDAHDTTFTKEIRGGFVTFLTMSYILLVNPKVVSDWMGGANEALFPAERLELEKNVATGTALVCSLGTITVGMVSNLPFAIGPGMSMNSVFAGSIALATNRTQFGTSMHKWDVAVTSAFFGGLIVLLLGVAGLGPKILRWLPDVLKSAIRVGIGLFQCFLALREMRVIQSEPTELLKFVDHFHFSDHGEDGAGAQLLFACTLMLTSSLYVVGVRSPILISICLTTIICWITELGGVSFPTVPVQVPRLDRTWWNYDWAAYVDDASAIGISFSYVVITLFDVGGAMFAIMAVIREASDLDQRDARLNRSEQRITDLSRTAEDDDDAEHNDANESDGLVGRTHAVDGAAAQGEDTIGGIATSDAKKVYGVIGVATMFSSMVGCSPTVVFLECLAGAASGSRTGFSSVITGLLFLVSLPFGPIVHNVPSCAAIPALVLIGCFMMSSVGEIPWSNHKKAFPAFVTIMLMPFTASITPGIVGGVLTYAALEYVDVAGKAWKQWKRDRDNAQRRTSMGGDVIVA